MLGALGPHGGDAGVQHVVDSRVAVEAPLHVVLAVRLVALLVPAVLQTVPLQVLERGAAGGDTAVTYWLGTRGPPAARPDPLSLAPRRDREVPGHPQRPAAGLALLGTSVPQNTASSPRRLAGGFCPGVRCEPVGQGIVWKRRAKQDWRIKLENKIYTLNELFL